MSKYNKTGAFLVIISIVFPLFHQEPASISRNGKKFVYKNVIKIKSNTNNSNIKISKKNSRFNDIDLCIDELLFIIPDSKVKNFSTASLFLVPLLRNYYFCSKATFS